MPASRGRLPGRAPGGPLRRLRRLPLTNERLTIPPGGLSGCRGRGFETPMIRRGPTSATLRTLQHGCLENLFLEPRVCRLPHSVAAADARGRAAPSRPRLLCPRTLPCTQKRCRTTKRTLLRGLRGLLLLDGSGRYISLDTHRDAGVLRTRVVRRFGRGRSTGQWQCSKQGLLPT